MSVPRRSALRVMCAAGASLTVGVMPVFLFGALSDDIGDEFGFGSARAGLAITIFFAASAVTAAPMGRLTDRVGATITMRLGVALSGVVTVIIGSVASSWWHIAAVMPIAGAAIALIDTGGARSFADVIPTDRHGIAFGAKEASIPAAALIAGLSIPLLVGRYGWGPIVTGAAILAPLAALVVPSGLTGTSPTTFDGRHRGPDDKSPRWPATLVIAAVGVAFGAAASSAAATLFVPAVTAGGWTASGAGVLLAVASVVSIGVRVVTGWVSDTHPRSTQRMLVGALILGASGAALLATSSAGPLVPIGAILLLGAGWGWTGLAFLTALRSWPHAPAVAAGIVLTGLASGGALGPAAFGIVAAQWSYGVAWTGASVALVLSAAIAATALRHTARHDQRPA